MHPVTLRVFWFLNDFYDFLTKLGVEILLYSLIIMVFIINDEGDLGAS